ncbi:proline-rich protein 36 [Bactrocera dorsalis]|uniref:Proline-rich protein 36 n=1 Tax=Bactrocera dorsalis TaxID=27457 RepID=A0A6I9VJL2_BACDO|nr:proline-rich protein 36 [Bactrocera dorsalis]
MTMQLLILLVLWRCLLCYGESTITHATKVSKRQLQYGGNFPSPPSYQTHGNQLANNLLQTPQLLYDPGYNAQQPHEVGAEADNTTDAAELSTPNATQTQQQQQTPANLGLAAQFEAPQTFSHIYFPHAFAPGAQLALSRTAPHAFPGETPAALAARNSGRSYSTSSTYFVPMSVLYHPNAEAQLQQSIYAQRLPQQMQAYNPLPAPLPPPALYQQYAPQAALPPTQPTATPTISAESTQLTQQPAQQQTISQQQAAQQTSLAYTPPALPPLPRMPHLLPPSPLPASSPLPLNFQAPFHPSQFLGYMHERDARNSLASTTATVNARTPHHTQANPAYPQQQVEKPIYEHAASGTKQQNYQAAVTQQARYGRYIYMAPNSGYALFKAA